MDNEVTPPVSPRKGDVLFRGDLPDWLNNASLNPVWGDSEVGYIEGYRRGARLLIDHVLETGLAKDFLVYPIIFLYRHHIELTLKRIMMRAPYLLGCHLSDEAKSHLGKHKLDNLWKDLKPMLARICEAAGWGKLDSADVEGVDDYIRQLSTMDPDSYSFRYKYSKKESVPCRRM